MGRQIVHHDSDHVGLWIMDVDQITHAFGKVYRGALLGDLHSALWSMGVDEGE